VRISSSVALLADAQIVAIERLTATPPGTTTPIFRRSARQLQAGRIHAVDLDDAGLRVERAMQQRDRGRFAGAGRPDQRDGLAGPGQ